jgi:hypothetical protein
MNTTNLYQSLATGITRTTKEAVYQNEIQREQLDYIKEKDAKKKNKAEKRHHTSQRLVLNMTSINSNFPTEAEEIPKSYLHIINSNTAGMVNRELQHQISELGLVDTGFTHRLAQVSTWATSCGILGLSSNLSPLSPF